MQGKLPYQLTTWLKNTNSSLHSEKEKKNVYIFVLGNIVCEEEIYRKLCSIVFKSVYHVVTCLCVT